MNWLERSRVVELLGVKPQSLYAYVSRGLVRARPHPDDPRASLYNADDVARLAQRRRSSRAREAIAEDALAWGEPVMATALTGVDGGRLVYAGRDAVEMSGWAGLEDVARLLWGDPDGVADGPRTRPPEGDSEKARMLAYLAGEAPAEPGPFTAAEGWRLLQGFVDAACGTRGRGPVQDRLAAHWRAPSASDAIRRALVLVADHELNPSTFAARVAAGAGAGLAACALAGLATLTGSRHGEAASGALVFLRAATGGADLEGAVQQWLAAGAHGVGHPLYVGQDPRAEELQRHFARAGALDAAMAAASAAADGRRPNIDMALAALTVSCNLPQTAPFVLFATGRMVGWIAHALEQTRSGHPIRPRARYTGPAAPSGAA
jgi:citrate synthase